MCVPVCVRVFGVNILYLWSVVPSQAQYDAVDSIFKRQLAVPLVGERCTHNLSLDDVAILPFLPLSPPSPSCRHAVHLQGAPRVV